MFRLGGPSARNHAALGACHRFLDVALQLEAANRDKLPSGGTALAPFAVSLLFAKAITTYRAILLLATSDYGEDAMVLARSLANLCFNLAYISQRDSEERARDWSAAGKVARCQMAEQFEIAPPDAAAGDWPEIEGRAKRWTRPGALRERAITTDNRNLYDLAYRHGSTFEHSDAWSVASFEPGNEHLREGLTNTALLVAGFALFHVTVRWGRFFGIDVTAAEQVMEQAFLSAFPRGADTSE